MGPARRRFLVIGLDGGTFDLLDPLMDAGEMPYLRQLATDGLRAPLRSVYPPKTIPAWYSLATGQDPGGLGIFGFTEPDGGPGKSKLVQSFRPAEAVWDTLSRHGVRVGVLNFPLRAGYPLNGFVIPGMLADRAPSYPAPLRGQVEAELGEPYPSELPPFRDRERDAWMERAAAGVAARGRAAGHLARRFRPDFLFVLFRETDRVEHQLWSELKQPVDRMAPDLRAFWRAVDGAVRTIDEGFRDAEHPGVTLVVSDHGHGTAESEFFTNRWLLEQEFLCFRNGGESFRRRALSRLLLASEKVPTLRSLLRPAADFVRERSSAERVGKFLTGEATFESMAEKIDWERTVAFSYPVPEGIYLNRYNPHLTPEKGEAVIREIRSRLEAYPDAEIEVFDPREIYQGQNLRNAPALLLRIDGMRTDPRMDFSYPEPMMRDRPSFFYGSGTHRMDGILIAHGDDVPAMRHEAAVSILDIAPTILAEMGVPIPPVLPGQSIGPLLNSNA